MVFNWDISGANNIRNQMLPVQSPYYMKVSTEDGRDLLWFVRKKGEKVGIWVPAYKGQELIKWTDFKFAQQVLVHVATQSDVKEHLVKMGCFPGNYKVQLVYQRQHEVAATVNIVLSQED